ncbi:hydroxymethylglutaryl-CoA lyase [Inmirania thermothiophila]|uniref:hydroxymethylglutaryl-CoA lyase n=1 Tax=Inmirania thermothiophila TaxID=1750597 RepID=A0A3N1Y1P4_9GAMM|nr:hydroxymethylglutaryl-CoA lyase [Inmirania thermothiophila]ROR32438.1 hydroxymethylglutaryl-CoA lyase [Inmirania thermothiophila]
MSLPARVRIVEVGPRDGLQNEPRTVPVQIRAELVRRLADAGLAAVEAGSFVSPRWVPQMADTEAVLAALPPRPGVRYPVLVPNEKGLERALAAGAREIAVFAAASETFSRRNINCTVDESLARFAPVVARARAAGLAVRGYVSCVLGCPYEGAVAPEAVVRVAAALHAMGCYEISLGDTIGVGTPGRARALVKAVAREVPVGQLAVHFHDTYGQALANIYAVLELGVSVVDSAVGGLGGCPYAPGAAGNVATEDVLYLLHGLGIETGVDLDAVVDTAWWIAAALERAPASRVAHALRRRRG